MYWKLCVALYICIDQTDLNAAAQEFVIKQFESLGSNLEWFSEVALQWIYARAAAVEVAFHAREQSLEVHGVLIGASCIAVVYRRHDHARAAQAIANRHVRVEVPAILQIALEGVGVNDASKAFCLLQKCTETGEFLLGEGRKRAATVSRFRPSIWPRSS